MPSVPLAAAPRARSRALALRAPRPVSEKVGIFRDTRTGLVATSPADSKISPSQGGPEPETAPGLSASGLYGASRRCADRDRIPAGSERERVCPASASPSRSTPSRAPRPRSRRRSASRSRPRSREPGCLVYQPVRSRHQRPLPPVFECYRDEAVARRARELGAYPRSARGRDGLPGGAARRRGLRRDQRAERLGGRLESRPQVARSEPKASEDQKVGERRRAPARARTRGPRASPLHAPLVALPAAVPLDLLLALAAGHASERASGEERRSLDSH